MNKLKIEIKNRWTGRVLFEYEKENNTIKDTLTQALKKGAKLEGANLEGANLRGAYLIGAKLRGAYIYMWDNGEPNISEIIENLEANSNIKVKNYYINKHILSLYYLTYWIHGLIIDEYEIIENKKEVKKMTVAEICKELGYEVEIIKDNKDERNDDVLIM